MRELIQIVESSMVRPLFHGSRTRFKVGAILKPQREGYVAGSGLDAIQREAHHRLEAILERYRPTDAVPRHQAVFLCDNIQDIDNAGGYLDFVYTAEPLGPVTKCNLDWYSELYGLSFDEVDEDDAARLATHYWEAAPSPNATYEYLTTSARVIELVETN